jgi:cytidylate kinase
MTAAIVAFSVQIGSEGFTLARRVAEQLGYRYYDWEITSEAAARAGVSPTEVIAAERVPSFLERIMQRLGQVSAVSIEGSPGLTEPSPAVMSTALQAFTSEDYRQFIEKVVLELAERGDAVIVGHAAQYTLAGKSGALRVLVHGSPDRRAQRLAEEQQIDLEAALLAIRQSDKDRGELLKRVYHFDWLDAAMYDLTLNTDHLSLEAAADLVLASARAMP